jgi:hypothetical protein
MIQQGFWKTRRKHRKKGQLWEGDCPGNKGSPHFVFLFVPRVNASLSLSPEYY